MMEDGDPSKTCEHLREAVEAVLRLRQSRANQEARESLARDALGSSSIAADVLDGRSQRRGRQGQRQEHVTSPGAAAPQMAAPATAEGALRTLGRMPRLNPSLRQRRNRRARVRAARLLVATFTVQRKRVVTGISVATRASPPTQRTVQPSRQWRKRRCRRFQSQHQRGRHLQIAA